MPTAASLLITQASLCVRLTVQHLGAAIHTSAAAMLGRARLSDAKGSSNTVVITSKQDAAVTVAA